MSYQPPLYPPQPPAAAAPRPRPAVVTLAAALMMATAGLGLITAITMLATLGQIVERLRTAAAGTSASRTDIDNLAAGIQAVTIGTAVIMVIGSLLLFALSLGVLRGSNLARILTWIVSGLGLLCGCCGIIGTIGQTTVPSLETTGTANQAAEQLGRALQEAYPTWWLVFNGAMSALQMVGYIVVAVLLALPAANEFFRGRQPQQWQPPQWEQPRGEPPPPGG